MVMVPRVRVFKTKWMTRYARRERIADTDLLEAIHRAERGLIDADLGGGLIKQRVARKGQGRSGGYRMVIGYRAKNRAVFLLGFAKNERENIEENELRSLREVAHKWLIAEVANIEKELELGNLQEIYREEEEK